MAARQPSLVGSSSGRPTWLSRHAATGTVMAPIRGQGLDPETIHVFDYRTPVRYPIIFVR
jgi:hypothetical protein